MNSLADVATYLGDYAPGSDAWAAARQNGLGGSEVAAVLGISPFESPFSLWHRKAGLVGPVEQTPEMEWGNRLEAAVATKFADDHPDITVRPGGAWRSHPRPWQIAHPDRILHTPDGVELLEVKTALGDIGWGEAGTDDIPVYYRSQALHYLDVLGLHRCRVAVLIGGFDYREYHVEYAAAEVAEIRQRCVEFLDSVTARRRPSVDDHIETYVVIRELHPDIEPESVELNSETAEAYLAANEAFKAAQAAKRLVTSQVADEMGNARSATHAGDLIAIRLAKGDGVPFVQAKPVRKKAAA